MRISCSRSWVMLIEYFFRKISCGHAGVLLEVYSAGPKLANGLHIKIMIELSSTKRINCLNYICNACTHA